MAHFVVLLGIYSYFESVKLGIYEPADKNLPYIYICICFGKHRFSSYPGCQTKGKGERIRSQKVVSTMCFLLFPPDVLVFRSFVFSLVVLPF